MQKSVRITRTPVMAAPMKRLKPLTDTPEWTDLMEALKAAKSEPAFKSAISEFKKKHSGTA